MKITITKTRKRILDFILSFHEKNQYMPTVREIGEGIGQNNPSVVQYHMDRLRAVGLLEKSGSGIRDISVNLGEELVVVDDTYSKGKSTRRTRRIPIDKEIGMIEYFGGCAYCGEIKQTYHKDHFVPIVLGGNNEAGNILLACRSCNLDKGGKNPVNWTISRFGVDRLEKIILFLGTR